MSDLAVESGIPSSLAALGDDRTRSRAHLSRLAGVVGVAVLLVVWELLAVFVFEGKHIMPTPIGVVEGLWDNRTLLRENTGITMAEAAQGYLWGNVLAVAIAFVFVTVPAVEAALLRLAIASYCMPIIALAPILNIVLSGDRPKIVLAGLSVFFTTLVGTTAGLRSADRTSLDVISAYGGGSWSQLVKVRTRAALPSLFAALRIAAPAAVLGAILGEYLGGTHGLGVAMINAEQSLDVTRVWSLALFAALIAGVGYALTGLIANLVTPWAKAARSTGAGASHRLASSGLPLRLLRFFGFLVISIGATLVVWIGFIKLFHLNSYFAKSPSAVWDYLFDGSSAGANRLQIWHALLTTLRDASFGYIAGTIIAVALAMAVVTYRLVEGAFMPVAVVLRSVPLTAMTPLIALALGRGLVSVTVIAGIVTFFPTLVNVVQGLRSAPDDAILLMRAFDASEVTTLFKVRLPSALPSLFSSARIAAPGALTGAVLASSMR
jgi:sulfonate transport system permease protein